MAESTCFITGSCMASSSGMGLRWALYSASARWRKVGSRRSKVTHRASGFSSSSRRWRVVMKAVYRVGIQPVPGGQGADAVIGAVQYTVAVQDHELHGRDLLIRLIRFIIPLFILLYKEQKETHAACQKRIF